MIIAEVTVHYKQGILDPQGKAVHHALQSLDIQGVGEVLVGSHIVLKYPSLSKEEARAATERACEKILSNPVIEDYEFELVEEKS